MNQTLTITDLSIINGSAPLCQGLTFSIAPREVVTIMGPSGSGKSTLLSWISGALPPNFNATGSLSLGEKELTGLPIEKRGIAILFQDDLLFPHMTAMENLLFALPGGRRKHRETEAATALADMDLGHLKHRRPDALSGGQKARISLMRALLSKPEAVLLDEPFSKLDKPLRKNFRGLVFDKIRSLGIPALLVTHDEDDIPTGGRIIHLE